MRLARFSTAIGACALVLLAAAVGGGTRALAQSDPHHGTWTFNPAKSKYTGIPAPKEQTSVYTVTNQSVTVTTTGTGADGKPTNTEFTANFDGKDYPVKGNRDWDAVAAKRVDSHTIEFTRKRGGKTVQTATSTVAKDGKTRTITVNGVNADGQKVSYVAVYEKK
jgi:hypothetical protein